MKTHTHANKAALDAITTEAAASQVEAEDGTEAAIRKFSPLRIAQAIAALGGGGGASISTPKVAYVETTGNNATGAIGNPALPYLTAQAAYDALAAAAAGSYTLHLGVGTFAGITLSAAWSSNVKSITGCGNGSSFLGGISGNGATGAPGNPGAVGGAGRSIDLSSDYSVNLGEVNVLGGEGGYGASTTDAGGDGGVGGNVRLRQCVVATVNNVSGVGGGGNENYSGAGGAGAALHLHQCIVLGDITTGPGAGGPDIGVPWGAGAIGADGSYYIAGCRFDTLSCTSTTGASDYVVNCIVTTALPGVGTVVNTTVTAETAWP